MIFQQKTVNCDCLEAKGSISGMPWEGEVLSMCTRHRSLHLPCSSPAAHGDAKAEPWSDTGMFEPAEWGTLMLQHFPKLSQYIWWILSKEADQITWVKIKWMLWMLQCNMLTNNAALLCTELTVHLKKKPICMK